MRKLLLLILLLPAVSLAHQMTCYSGGKKVYDHHVHDISYFENLITFEEDGTNKSVVTDFDCIAKIE